MVPGELVDGEAPAVITAGRVVAPAGGLDGGAAVAGVGEDDVVDVVGVGIEGALGIGIEGFVDELGRVCAAAVFAGAASPVADEQAGGVGAVGERVLAGRGVFRVERGDGEDGVDEVGVQGREVAGVDAAVGVPDDLALAGQAPGGPEGARIHVVRVVREIREDVRPDPLFNPADGGFAREAVERGELDFGADERRVGLDEVALRGGDGGGDSREVGGRKGNDVDLDRARGVGGEIGEERLDFVGGLELGEVADVGIGGEARADFGRRFDNEGAVREIIDDGRAAGDQRRAGRFLDGVLELDNEWNGVAGGRAVRARAEAVAAVMRRDDEARLEDDLLAGGDVRALAGNGGGERRAPGLQRGIGEPAAAGAGGRFLGGGGGSRGPGPDRRIDNGRRLCARRRGIAGGPMREDGDSDDAQDAENPEERQATVWFAFHGFSYNSISASGEARRAIDFPVSF